MEEQIQRVYDAGFRHMDMNFWDWCHDPASPFLIGNYREDDRIHDVPQKSWIDGQTTMRFD